MVRRFVALVIMSGLAISACASGSDESTPATSPATTVPATEAPPTTSPPSTTTPATAPPTTSPTATTLAPTTTLDPTAKIEAAVKQARLDLEDAYFAAASDPGNDFLRDVYRSAFAEGNFTDREAFLDRLLSGGTTLRSSLTTPKAISFPAPTEVVSDAEVIIAVCRVDSDIVRIPETETAPEVIVDDRIITTLTRTRFVLGDGRWVNAGAELIREWNGVTTCEL